MTFTISVQKWNYMQIYWQSVMCSEVPVPCGMWLQTQVREVMAECDVSEGSVTRVSPLQDELGRLQTQAREVTAENETLTAQLGEVSHVTTAAAPVVTQGSTAGAGEQQTHLETITKVWWM